MPFASAMASSSGLVTCDAMISALAPGYTVVTITMGESVTGYSRVPRNVYPTIPNNINTTDITPASTGREMLICEIALIEKFVLEFGQRPAFTHPNEGSGRNFGLDVF
jgi:hypothetical protein